ncbi:LysM peptidoglycan-binding domain-containing protein [Streptosporangium sp. NPDC050855]|uniref:LysM peptidoglycan-binding domain-containing protein n=1 Tax=Streptosporangium sp. NPDC050855 TaxID=3366194 RepID=UPI0037BE0EAF
MAESRYEGMRSVYTKRRGALVRGRELRPNRAWSFRFTEYIVKEGDRVDLIAFRNYGDAGLWYMIADANPEILDWMTVSPGMKLRLPNVLA